MAAFLDVCRFTPTAGGTTDWTFSTAVVGYQSPTAAGAVNGTVYRYRAESADLSQWEIGHGAYNSGTGVFARSTVLFNSLGTTAKVSFTVAPQVAIVALAEDLPSLSGALNTFTGIIGVAGGQIAFPATQNPSADPNTLDDYEEGTWTPVLTFATPGNLSVTYSRQKGFYTKIGRLVTVSFDIETSAFSFTTASGNLIISGLPFATLNDVDFRAHSIVGFQGVTRAGYTQFYAILLNNVTTMLVGASGSGQGISTLSTGDTPTGGVPVFGGSVSYPT
jgi:hypothetical protein